MGVPARSSAARRPPVALRGLALATLVLSACAGPAVPTAPLTASPSPSSAATATTGPSSPATLAADLVFTRSGGIAGTRQRLVVHPDGTLEAVGDDGTPSSGRLGAEELAGLAALVASTDLAALAGERATPGGADDITYGIGYGRLHVDLPASAVPGEAVPLVTALGELLDDRVR